MPKWKELFSIHLDHVIAITEDVEGLTVVVLAGGSVTLPPGSNIYIDIYIDERRVIVRTLKENENELLPIP